MNEMTPISGRDALVDGKGRLIEASPALAQLNRRAGAGDDNRLVIPALADLCQQCADLGMRLSRPVRAADDSHDIEMWVDAVPEDAGVAIHIRRWHSVPAEESALMPLAEPPVFAADGHLRLDAAQRIVTARWPAALASPPGIAEIWSKSWLDVVEFTHLAEVPAAQPEPLWHSLRQRSARLPGSEAEWITEIFPILDDRQAIRGFHVLFTAQEEAPAPGTEETDPPVLSRDQFESLFGGSFGAVLKQPIGRIIANAETIGGRLQGPIRSDYANYAHDIADAGRHLLALVEDLSDLEAVDRDNFTVSEDDIDLADLGRRAAGLLAVKASDHQIRIDAPAHDESLPARGEFRRVLQILLNLIGNAINYSPDGSMIWLRVESEGDRATITVADQGPGMSLEDQARVFEKFERLGRSGDGGSGLGLYISRKLARHMGGDVTVESAPGQGARFTLDLPAR